MVLTDSNLMVIVGESSDVHELRRSFARDGIPHAGVTTHLTGLRRALVVGAFRRVVLCLSMDGVTLRRHGDALRQVLADRGSFAIGLCSVGLLTDRGLRSKEATLGCDVYLDDWREASATIEAMTARPAFESAASPLDRCTGTPLAKQVDLLRRNGWDCCKPPLPGNGDGGTVFWPTCSSSF